MKKTFIFMILIALLSMIVFSGCVIQTDKGSNTAIQMNGSGSIETLPSTLTVTKGSTFGYSLDANMTTGYSWQVYIEDESIVELVDNVYEPDETDEEAAGSGGVATITLKALKKGETTITLEYAQDWEGGETGKSKDITIVVE